MSQTGLHLDLVPASYMLAADRTLPEGHGCMVSVGRLQPDLGRCLFSLLAFSSRPAGPAHPVTPGFATCRPNAGDLIVPAVSGPPARLPFLHVARAGRPGPARCALGLVTGGGPDEGGVCPARRATRLVLVETLRGVPSCARTSGTLFGPPGKQELKGASVQRSCADPVPPWWDRCSTVWARSPHRTPGCGVPGPNEQPATACKYQRSARDRPARVCLPLRQSLNDFIPSLTTNELVQ
jgi:hypothetical protein